MGTLVNWVANLRVLDNPSDLLVLASEEVLCRTELAETADKRVPSRLWVMRWSGIPDRTETSLLLIKHQFLRRHNIPYTTSQGTHFNRFLLGEIFHLKKQV